MLTQYIKLSEQFTRPLVGFFIIAMFFTQHLFAYDVLTEKSVKKKSLFSTNDFHYRKVGDSLKPVNHLSALSTFNGSTYLIWVDKNRRPKLAKITQGTVQTVFLESNDYQIPEDGHHTFSLGIDKEGYIHVTGDMHNFREGKVPDYYLERFKDANIMYWVSNEPEDITGFTFQNQQTQRHVPGYGFSYTRYYNDRNMELYMVARINVKGSYAKGTRAVGLYHYDTDTQTWTARGGIITSSNDTLEYRNILWANAGGFPNQGYQGFQVSLDFDMNNRMHFAATINTDNLSYRSNVIVYAYSDDGGQTFHSANGKPIENLPMRVDEEGLNPELIVEQIAPNQNEYYWIFAGVFTDGKGNPSITVQRWDNKDPNNENDNTVIGTYIHTFNPITQQWDIKEPSVPAPSSTVQHLADSTGVMTYLSDQGWGQIARYAYEKTSEGEKDIKHHIKGNWAFSNIDRLALRHEGIYRMIGIGVEDNVNNTPEEDILLTVQEIEFIGTGSFTKETWNNIEGNHLDSLWKSVNFPNSPDTQQEIEGDLKLQSNQGNNYATRLRGMIRAPQTGEYTFYISGDNHAELWLSNDATIEGSSRIAYINKGVQEQIWTKFPEQQSSKIFLEKEKRYYFEVVHKESKGQDHLAVGWLRPEMNTIEVIEKKYLSPWLAIPTGAFGKKIKE